jgi:hypothetical protein
MGDEQWKDFMIPLSWYLALSAVLFTIGVVGVISSAKCDRALYVHRVDAQCGQPDSGRFLAISR